MFRQDFTCPALLKSRVTLFSYGTITLSGSSFQTILITNDAKHRPDPLSLATTHGVSVDFLSFGY